MLFYFFGTLRTQSSMRVLVKKAFEEVSQLIGNVTRDVRLTMLDFVEELVAVLAVERRKTSDHFEDDGTQAPPVDCLAMSFLKNDFRGEVRGGSADGHGVVVLHFHL